MEPTPDSSDATDAPETKASPNQHVSEELVIISEQEVMLSTAAAKGLRPLGEPAAPD